MNSVELSIIVISYNTREMTLACLRSVFNETRETSFELIVFDNASLDGSADAIRAEFGNRIRFIASQANLGFAVANNRAAEEARGKYFLLLNPDTVVLDRAIDRLIAFARTYSGAGIWGGRTLFSDGRLNPASCWSRQSVWSLFCQAAGLSSLFRRSSVFNPEAIGGWDRSGLREVDIVAGCFLLLRRELWQTLQGFREIFFMYGEEADLCLRAREIGARPIVTSAATIIHYGGASERVHADKLVRLLTAKMLLVHLHFSSAKQVAKWLLAMWPISRYWAHAMLSCFGRKASVEKHQLWREVVQRHGEWNGEAILKIGDVHYD